MTNKKTVVVGVCGGIAAYKTCELVSRLKKSGFEVRVVMTKNATQFVSPLTFETLSDYPAVVDTFQEKREWEVQHIALAKKADVFVVAPATANFIGKFACGIADDFLTTTIMATKAPILLCPAMNCDMLQSAACVKNLTTLNSRNIHILYGDEGVLACGDIGKGRMAEPIDIFNKIEEILAPNRDFLGKKILVTAGATIEKIDQVRFITNFSSGKMGCEIAKNAAERGAEVTLVLGKHTADVPQGVNVIDVETTSQMYDAVLDRLPDVDVVVKAAAPCDYVTTAVAPQKIKSDSLTLVLHKNPDIAAEVGKRKGDKILVVFAAETENLIENAKQKMQKKNADFVVANDVLQDGAGFNTDTNVISLVDKDGVRTFDKQSKADCARIILDKVKTLIK